MKSQVLLQKKELARIMERLASQIIEKHDECEQLMLVGIQRRGVDIAARLAAILAERLGKSIPLGSLDINFYRDDWTSLKSSPQVGTSSMPHDVENSVVLLVDDVLYTGRTIRAALEALMDYGRPRAVELLVLVDRGHRELPIHADFVGRQINTSSKEHINVLLEEKDGIDQVVLSKPD
ncbi:MAG: bifunctional pyr operon transcriptional regulator/uracil phosphoribosyltransferase PyrR [Desulfovibrionaceae bacterium]|nr:bifunctional pyr operon transcriptional regulator/uracil phosphoribosyltransferase PyrR [Desulfovibrionaceae bacterium]